MSILPLLMACLTQTTPAPAPVTVPLRIDTDAYTRLIERLQAASSDPVHSRQIDGRVSNLILNVPAEGDDALSRARSFLDEYGMLLGLDDDRQALTLTRARSGSLDQLRFSQSIDGVEVAHAEVIVLLERDSVVGVVAQLAAVPAEAMDAPLLSTEAAIDVARETTRVEHAPVQAPQLEWVDPALSGGEGEAGLAWRVSFIGGGGRVWISAESGAVLAYDPLRYEASPDVDIIDAGEEDPDFVCWNGWSGTTVCDEDSCDSNAPEDSKLAQQESLDTWDHYLDRHDWLSWDNANEEIEIITNMLNLGSDGNEFSNAFSSPGCAQLMFTPGMVVRDLYGHETGHMLASRRANLLYVNQGAAIHEHLGDAFGVLYAETFDGLDWQMAENGKSGSFRTLGVTAPLDFSSFNASQGPHSNSLIPSNAFRLLHSGGTYGGITITALGADKVADLWFGTMRDRLPSSASFVTLRHALVDEAQAFADSGQGGFTDSDVCQVKNAFKAVQIGVDFGDLDCDGIDDGMDMDADNDSVFEEDNCPEVSNFNQLDVDGDGLGDACDGDDDDDGIPDASDPCPDVPEPDTVTDVDNDGVVDHCEDEDGDGIIDELDNCPEIHNPSNNDGDSDGIGNACDPDKDGDGVDDEIDNCVGINSANQDDEDGDGVGDLCDSCLGLENPDQGDDDSDGLGDACDDDIDGDGVENDDDNCDYIFNPSQSDGDGDGVGTFCDGDEMEAMESGAAFFWDFSAEEAMFIDLPMCEAGLCGDWLGLNAVSSLTIDADVDLWVGLVDSGGVMISTTTAAAGEAASIDFDAYALYGELSVVVMSPEGSTAEATMSMNQDW